MQKQPNLEGQVAESETMSEQADERNVGLERAKEYGGPKGMEPTRYGDWERNGRCIDF